MLSPSKNGYRGIPGHAHRSWNILPFYLSRFLSTTFFLNSCNYPPLQPCLNWFYSVLTSSNGSHTYGSLELGRFSRAEVAHLIASIWILIFDAGSNNTPFSILSHSNYIIICVPFFLLTCTRSIYTDREHVKKKIKHSWNNQHLLTKAWHRWWCVFGLSFL